MKARIIKKRSDYLYFYHPNDRRVCRVKNNIFMSSTDMEKWIINKNIYSIPRLTTILNWKECSYEFAKDLCDKKNSDNSIAIDSIPEDLIVVDPIKAYPLNSNYNWSDAVNKSPCRDLSSRLNEIKKGSPQILQDYLMAVVEPNPTNITCADNPCNSKNHHDEIVKWIEPDYNT